MQFVFPQVEPHLREWWLVLTRDEADVCDTDPGHDVDVLVTADLRALTAVWMGNRTWQAALRDGSVAIDGTEALRREFPTWLKLSMFAGVPRVMASS